MPRRIAEIARKSTTADDVIIQKAAGVSDVNSFVRRLKNRRSTIRGFVHKKKSALPSKSLDREVVTSEIEVKITTRKKSAKELGALARDLAGETSPKRAAAIKKQMVAGFYGRA